MQNCCLIALTIFLVATTSTSHFVSADEHLGFCNDLSCAPRETLLETIRQLTEEKMRRPERGAHPSVYKQTSKAKDEVRSLFGRVRAEVDNSTCSICNSNPCQNGGTCIPDPDAPFEKYRCICPDDYSGDFCGQHHVCTNTTCGTNANCFVSNHQTNCVCKPGFMGDPLVACNITLVESCAWGDPHPTTFDGLKYDYQGTCPIIYSEPCSTNSLGSPYSYYSVKAKADLYKPNPSVSVFTEVEVEFYNQFIHIDGHNRNVYVNGLLVHVPFYYPSISNTKASFTITYTPDVFTVENDQHVRVTFNVPAYRLCVAVPNVPQFQGENTLCGLAGNIDGDKSNDVRYRNGTVLPIADPNQYQPTRDNYLEFNKAMDSWITDEFLKLYSGQCITGEQVSNNTNCDKQTAVNRCDYIQQAMAGEGVFAKCQPLGNETITLHYDTCVFDVCHMPEDLCSPLVNFAEVCVEKLPNTNLGNWRNQIGCPLTCPLNSHYSTCKSTCPATCANVNQNHNCPYGCTDGCVCDDGYVLNNNNLTMLTCIPVSQCGCISEDGNSHPANETWLTNNCTVSNICSNGTVLHKPNECSPNGFCGIDGRRMPACLCDPGYEGDGYNCTSIDYCKNKTICGQAQGHGTCTNTPGNYTCTCNTYFSGSNCEVYAPRRHCADLYVYHGFRSDGVYTIQPPFAFGHNPPNTNVTVFCVMTIEDGGWTIMSHQTGASTFMSNRSMMEYMHGFDLWQISVGWLGLDLIHGLTNLHSMSLRLDLQHCASHVFNAKQIDTDCTYKYFSVQNASQGYRVVIPEACTGSEQNYTGYAQDGWARWNLSEPGPQFATFDDDNDGCSVQYRNTGWWFDTLSNSVEHCGNANLNGISYRCDVTPPADQLDTYLYWNSNPLNAILMTLRPTDYPNYDPISLPPI